MSKKKTDIISTNYSESRLTTRLKLAYQWLDGKYECLLDGGCSHGYGTRFFAQKAQETYGIDVDKESVEIANSRYPGINFKCAPLENTGFPDEFFDAIVITDVLEHTNDKIQSLSEMNRILKNQGTMIITTPHKGLFEFLDPYNYGYYLKKFMPSIYKSLFRFIRRLKNDKLNIDYNPAHLKKHFHYSESDLIAMLDNSLFKDNYEIEKILKSGLFLEVFAMNIESILNIIFKKNITAILIKPFFWLGTIEYWIKFGFLSYNIAMKIRRTL